MLRFEWLVFFAFTILFLQPLAAPQPMANPTRVALVLCLVVWLFMLFSLVGVTR